MTSKEPPMDNNQIAAIAREDVMIVIQRDNKGKPTVWCDPEIVDLITALNGGGIPTIASCSGHGHRPGRIMLADGRNLFITRNQDDVEQIEAQFPYDINGEIAAVRKHLETANGE